jgi:hypothetical protein
MKKLLAVNDAIPSIFGQVSPPAGTPSGDPVAAISKLLSTALQFVLLIAAFLLLLYMFLGAFDWITSGGEKEKIAKAQGKITSAIIGMVLVIAVFTVFSLAMGTVFGNRIIENIPGQGWRLIIPTIAP